MRLRVAARSDTGRVREANEDRFVVLDLDLRSGARMIAVADGMGGHKAGDVASSIALRELSGVVSLGAGPDGWLQSLQRGVEQANASVFEAALSNDNQAGMGTTLTAAVLDRGRLDLVHVGDSRAYLIRKGSMELLTQDDSLVQELVRMGDISPADALTHPQKNVLTRAVGTRPRVEVQIVSRELDPGDRVLLCSDGLYSLVSEEAILQALMAGGIQEGVEGLVDEANQRGGHDNITAVAVEVEGL